MKVIDGFAHMFVTIGLLANLVVPPGAATAQTQSAIDQVDLGIAEVRSLMQERLSLSMDDINIRRIANEHVTSNARNAFDVSFLDVIPALDVAEIGNWVDELQGGKAVLYDVVYATAHRYLKAPANTKQAQYRVSLVGSGEQPQNWPLTPFTYIGNDILIDLAFGYNLYLIDVPTRQGWILGPYHQPPVRECFGWVENNPAALPLPADLVSCRETINTAMIQWHESDGLTMNRDSFRNFIRTQIAARPENGPGAALHDLTDQIIANQKRWAEMTFGAQRTDLVGVTGGAVTTEDRPSLGVVRIQPRAGTLAGAGSGFYVNAPSETRSKTPWVITNFHVVSVEEYDNRPPLPRFRSPRPIVELSLHRDATGGSSGIRRAYGVVAAYDIRRDLALVHTSSCGVPLALDSRSDVDSVMENGARVVAIGYPAGREPASVTYGRISSTYRSSKDGAGDFHNIQHDAATAGGSSGGPLLSEDSNTVIGVSHAGLGNYEGFGYAIHYEEVWSFLDTLAQQGLFDNAPRVCEGP